MDIGELLAFGVKNGASDLHLSAGLPPMTQGRRRREAHQRAVAGPQDRARPRVRHHERQATQGLRGVSGDGLFVRDPGARAIPGQRVQPQSWLRGGLPDYSGHHHESRGSQVSRYFQGHLRHPARRRPRHRADRLGKVHHPRGDGQPQERDRVRPHPHGRGSDRVRAREQEVPDSTNARSTATPSASTRHFAPRCAKIPTSSWSARCATSRPSGSR